MQPPIDLLKQKWRDEASALKAASRYRTPFVCSPHSPLVDFASSDYLGMRTDPRLAAAGNQAVVAAGGSGSGASRAVLQFDPTLDELESFFANWVGFPSAVYCGSGFIANCVLFDALADTVASSQKTTVFLDHRAHASLYAATRLSGIPTVLFRHGDLKSLREKLQQSNAISKIIVVESLHSMDGTLDNAAALAQVCEEHSALLIADEAHTCGLLGSGGQGWTHTHPELKKHTLAVMFGCGKAVGVSGGIITGPGELRERIFQKSKPFLYTTGVSPFVSGAVLQSCHILASQEGQKKREQLFANALFFAEALKHTGVAAQQKNLSNVLNQANLEGGEPFYAPIFSIPMPSDETAVLTAQKLVAQGFLVRAMRAPTVPRNSPRLRVIVRANHQSDQLMALAQTLVEEKFS